MSIDNDTALAAKLDIDAALNDVIGILFGNALANGNREISWQDAPKLMAGWRGRGWW